ncbi:hypothetical protein [Larkinella sp. C7]|uniref:hypothetical protein n=1 Tax=Larkinella sp. C7 TaxID=2576607 RepID=UPI0011113CAC|nr:hypothetical protein [Larkinella sp. C7]
MAQSVVVISYANDRVYPFPSLKEEDEKVHACLQTRAATQPFRIIRESFVSRPQLLSILTTPSDRDNLLILLYSGHAAKDYLVTEEESTNVNGMSRLLSQCSSLNLLVLNGCSTLAQVKLIFEAFGQQNRKPPVNPDGKTARIYRNLLYELDHGTLVPPLSAEDKKKYNIR